MDDQRLLPATASFLRAGRGEGQEARHMRVNWQGIYPAVTTQTTRISRLI